MTTIAFRVDDQLKKQLTAIAENKGINLSALIKLYLTKAAKIDLNEITINGITLAEELEQLAQSKQSGDGKVYDNVEDLIKTLNEG